VRTRIGTALRKLIRHSPALTNFGVRVLGRVQRLRDRGLTPYTRWKRRASDETRYWAEALQADDARTAFADRLDPAAEIDDPVLIRALEEIAASDVSILDVGSGPLTSVGKVYPGKKISIVATDPLADDYASVLRDCRLDPPLLPIACGGEEIVERFGEEAFDIAFALNSLDHSADPRSVLDNMLAAIKPGGRVALRHMRNEGERNGYFGIHFWNIDCEDGRFLIWNRTERHDVTAELADRFEVESWTSGEDWINCLLRPRS
jgi:SAM-dependent methyltransferase